MIRDVLAGDQDNARSGSDYAADQIGIILHRARNRGEATPSVEQVLDVIVASVMYRILFRCIGRRMPKPLFGPSSWPWARSISSVSMVFCKYRPRIVGMKPRREG